LEIHTGLVVPTLKSGPNKALRFKRRVHRAHSLEWDLLIRMFLVLSLDVIDCVLEQPRADARH